MNVLNKIAATPTLAVYLFLWNLLDILVHVNRYLIEFPRITGNIIGLLMAVIILGLSSNAYKKYILAAGYSSIVIVNLFHAPSYGVEAFVSIFIGFSLLLIGRVTQIEFATWHVRKHVNDIYKKPIFLHSWFLLPVVILSVLIIFPIGHTLYDPYGYQYTSLEQTDTDEDIGVPVITDGLLVAFFGLDDTLPRAANNFVMGSDGMDGMPVIFSDEVDLSSVQAGDFQVTMESGELGYVHGVTFAPAVDEGELRTVLLTGFYGSTDDPAVMVEIVGNLYSMDRSINFKGSFIEVVPLLDGPTLVLAELVPESMWRETQGQRPSRNTYTGSGVPDNPEIKQVVRVTWSGGIRLENGDEPGDADLQKYVVTVRAGDGTMRQISPIAFGDLFDNDNNHLLALDTPDEVVSVMAIEGWVVDPNHDLNPETTVNINSS